MEFNYKKHGDAHYRESMMSDIYSRLYGSEQKQQRKSSDTTNTFQSKQKRGGIEQKTDIPRQIPNYTNYR